LRPAAAKRAPGVIAEASLEESYTNAQPIMSFNDLLGDDAEAVSEQL
jgi:hypothetical protein